MDEVTLARFIQLDEAGHSSPYIADKLGVTTRTVQRWRHQTGRSKAGRATPHPPAAREQARRILADGASRAEAARTIGVTARTIHRWFPDVPGWTKKQAGEYAELRRWEARHAHV